MSSHHVVREDQEPALVILVVDGLQPEMLGQLLEWSPTVITVADTAEKLNSFGIKVDYVITNDNAVTQQSDVKIIPASNASMTVTALRFLLTNNYKAVNIITDSYNVTELLPFIEKINFVIYNNDQKIYAVTPGFSKWKQAGEEIRILLNVNPLQHNGLKVLKPLSYETIADGFFSFYFNHPFMLIAEATYQHG